MTIEQQIEEVRAELRNAASAADRIQLEAELDLLRAELAVALAEMEGLIEAGPPF